MRRNIHVLGLDPGLATFAATSIEDGEHGVRLTAARVFLSDASAQKRGVAKSDDRFRRARDLAAWLRTTIHEADPDLVAIEAMSWPRGGHAIASIALSWGVIAAVCAGRSTVQAHPKAWRAAVSGDGSTSETAAHAVLSRMPGHEVIAVLEYKRRVHALDAAGVAVWSLKTDEAAAIRRGLES